MAVCSLIELVELKFIFKYHDDFNFKNVKLHFSVSAKYKMTYSKLTENQKRLNRHHCLIGDFWQLKHLWKLIHFIFSTLKSSTPCIDSKLTKYKGTCVYSVGMYVFLWSFKNYLNLSISTKILANSTWWKWNCYEISSNDSILVLNVKRSTWHATGYITT